jgi:hypothetical protein
MADFAPGTFTVSRGNYPNDPKFFDFAGFIGMPIKQDSRGRTWDYGTKAIEKLEKVYTWGKIKARSLDHEKIKKEVFNLTKKAGVNWMGEALLDRLVQHISFDSSVKKADYEWLEKAHKESKIDDVGDEIKLDKSKEKKPEKGVPSTVKPIQERNVNFRIKPLVEEIKISKVRKTTLKEIPLEKLDEH